MKRDLRQHGFPMSRSAFVLLLATLVLAVIPHLERLPGWMPLALVAVLVWRIQVFRQRWPFPGKLVRLLLVLAGFAGVILQFRTVLGPDAGVALLVTAYLFKQLETATRRDSFLVVILSYFVLATEFLFSRSIYSTAYVFLVLVVITATLVALNHAGGKVAIGQPLKVSGLLVLQSIPFMLALFFLFPRIGPLWQLNLTSKQNFIGISDRMSPGDIDNLSRSPALAFRAEFRGAIPPMRERYWRAAVFDYFDGRSWTAPPVEFLGQLDRNQLQQDERHYDYRVILEPSGQRWLMALAAADIKLAGVSATAVLTQVYKEPIDTPLAYEVISHPQFTYQADKLPVLVRSRNLQLPATGNEASRRHAQTLLQQAGGDPQKLVASILDNFRNEAFYYTLKPPLLGNNRVDEFLFQTRRGYCAHYAGALVFLLRSAGIPARVVGGYHGGAIHPLGQYLLVHQYDAHAWAEYWIAGQGWLRVDPTAAVAPHRIEDGVLDSATDASFLAESPLSPDKLRNLALFARARMLADYVDYLWFKNVVSYNGERQSQLFHSLLGQVTPQRIALLLGAVAGLILLVVVLGIWWRQPPLRPLDRADRLYLRFCTRLAAKGFERQPGEAPQAFADRISPSLPEQAASIRQITGLYLTLKYANLADSGNLKQTNPAGGDRLARLQNDLQRQVRMFRLQ